MSESNLAGIDRDAIASLGEVDFEGMQENVVSNTGVPW